MRVERQTKLDLGTNMEYLDGPEALTPNPALPSRTRWARGLGSTDPTRKRRLPLARLRNLRP